MKPTGSLVFFTSPNIERTTKLPSRLDANVSHFPLQDTNSAFKTKNLWYDHKTILADRYLQIKRGSMGTIQAVILI